MTGVAETALAWVCGQNLERTWAPGGEWLPCCQRCTGIYVGAAVALMLRWFWPLRSGKAVLIVNTLLLLQMVPSVLHWLPDAPWVRTASGVLFGFGEVGFLWVLVEDRLKWRRALGPTMVWVYGFAAVLTSALVPFLAARGGAMVAAALSGTAFAGLVGVLLLVLANLVLMAGRWMKRSWRTC